MSIKTIFLILAVFLVPVGLAQDSPLSALDMARASEVWRVLETHGRAVWSDWLPPPQLLRKADADYLIGHPNPPKDFARVSGIQIAGQAVYKRSGHLLPVPAATTWLVADVWVLAIPTLEEFQQAIDQVLGIGVVQLDDPTYIRAAVHEAFHAYQMTQMKQQLPMFGFEGDETKTLSDLSTTPAPLEQLVLEGQALREALMATNLQATRRALEQFLELRITRRSQLPSELAGLEQSLEWREGLARYAEVGLMTSLGGQNSHDGRFQYSEKIWSTFLEQLLDVGKIPGTLRDRYYALGAAQAFVLDRTMPGWKNKVIPGGSSLETLLEEVIRSSL